MGNYRFRLSDMLPNAWFYKLKDMAKTTTNNNNNHHISSSSSTHSLKKKQQNPFTSSAANAQPSKSKQPHHHHHHSYPRKSYYITRELITQTDPKLSNSPTNTKSSDTLFTDPPRKSSKHPKRPKKRPTRISSPKTVSSSVSAGCSCRAATWSKSDSPPNYSASPSDTSPDPEFRSDRVLTTDSYDEMLSWSSSTASKFDSSANDIIIDVDDKSLAKKAENLDVGDKISDLELPPIITKPAKPEEDFEEAKADDAKYRRRSSAKRELRNARDGSLSIKVAKEFKEHAAKEQKGVSGSIRRQSGNSPGVRLRVNSPRIGSRRATAHGGGRRSASTVSSSRSSLSESLAIVKSSFDPQKDFRDSMVEMIVENNIRASKDLEDLLACYLTLNSDEYHDLIIKVFKQIWFDLSDTKHK